MVRALPALAVILSWLSAAAKTVIIGDSLLTWGGYPIAGGSTVGMYLEQWSGHHIDRHAIVGAGLHEGWVKSVPDLYDEAKSEGVPTTIVMNGIANDIRSYRTDCQAFNNRCKQVIDEGVDIVTNLFARMSTDGVQSVLYLGWYYAENLNKAVDYATDKLISACASASVKCYFADVRALDFPRGADGLHPTDQGYKMFAQALWQLSQENGVPI